MIRIATIVQDEAHRYWGSALAAWKSFADDIVVFDDDSSDETKEMAEDEGCDIFTLFDCKDMWGNESSHRAALFAYAMGKSDPGDIVFWLDADMVPARNPSKFFAVEGVASFSFYLYDLWGKDSKAIWYRSDDWWKGHAYPRVWAVRVPERFSAAAYEWSGRGIHAGHLPPDWFTQNPGTMVLPKDMALLHYGYYTGQDRRDRHERYHGVRHKLHPEEIEHANTILDSEPSLFRLPFTPELELERAQCEY